LSPEARAFLDRERELPQLSPAARARSMARARAAILASGSARRAFVVSPSSKLRWAIAAAVLGVASAAAGATAYRFRDRLAVGPKASTAISTTAPAPARTSGRARSSHPSAPLAAAPLPSETDGIAAAPSASDVRVAAPASAPHRASRLVTGEDELRLLRRARAAVAAGDFEGALRPIAEHARRFPDGTLAEEREALRVKSLSAIGQAEEARRAASSFQRRFPNSVLVRVVEQLPARE
jgi:hypothetical protein